VRSTRSCDSITLHVILSNVGVMGVLNVKNVASLFGVVCTTKENINLLKRNGFGFGDEEPDKEDKEYIRCHEEEECFPIGLLGDVAQEEGGIRLTLRSS
jgi:hypothetical protein